MTERINGMLKRVEGHPVMRKVENYTEKMEINNDLQKHFEKLFLIKVSIFTRSFMNQSVPCAN